MQLTNAIVEEHELFICGFFYTTKLQDSLIRNDIITEDSLLKQHRI